ncbi:hypothetical protein GWK08_08315 [Leptobacterium flavescens]|uniref:Peptidase M1 membrane alanine aminopeptidase domain-containing protein n=1 Tax=Leptobacterium flavescens TaxID=472055 RepID=A0A6P0USU3_9FLAO|nr:M1 family aminopeptidase [Leptobacterium flavescens]NER13436.1 hypothetical protein [Leptobacterium flavescens]
MKSKYLILSVAFFLINLLVVNAQPHISGNVFIDMDTGLFKCNLKLSGLPELKEYKILLNKGMNIKYFKGAGGEIIPYSGYYDPNVRGEGTEYALTDDKRKEKDLPSEFEVSYIGAFPKYTDSLNHIDFKGIIALNDQTIRAAEQTKWYPVIYDAKNDRHINSYTYKLSVEVKGAKTIFINGSAPQQAEKAQFSSTKAVPLLLFAGDYDFVGENGNYILNASINKEIASGIFRNIETIKSYLAQKLDIAFTDNIYLIKHKPINKRRKGSSWGFNTYPAFAFTGLDFGTLVNEEGRFTDNIFKYFGHEFAHNYFGNNVMSGNLSWFWLESFAEYLSYNISEEMSGEEYLSGILKNHVNSVKNKDFIPLSQIESPGQIGDTYRYRMAPLILKCFDLNFGREKTNNTLKTLINFANTESLSLDLWEKAAMQSGISQADFNTFKEKFIDDAAFEKNTVEFISNHYKF